MKKEIIFITGGARSGKSTFAEKLSGEFGRRRVFLATAEAKDREMTERIKRHKKKRKERGWRTIEEPIGLAEVFRNINKNTDLVLLDCITLWINNLIDAGFKDSTIKSETKKMLSIIKKKDFSVIIVSNETGDGIVPADPVTRRYRDLLGTVNQIIAKNADHVYRMVCGIPVTIKKQHSKKQS